jgi:hypothetical protein
VPGEAQQRPLGAVAGPEILHRAERHALDAEAHGLQALRDQLNATLVVGADRRTADQVLGEEQRRVVGGSRQVRELRGGAGMTREDAARSYIQGSRRSQVRDPESR